MERIDPQMPTDVLGQVVMHLDRLQIEIQTAKNLVNGKPIDADRKLQGVLTRINNLLNNIEVARDHELANKSDQAVTDGCG